MDQQKLEYHHNIQSWNHSLLLVEVIIPVGLMHLYRRILGRWALETVLRDRLHRRANLVRRHGHVLGEISGRAVQFQGDDGQIGPGHATQLVDRRPAQREILLAYHVNSSGCTYNEGYDWQREIRLSTSCSL